MEIFEIKSDLAIILLTALIGVQSDSNPVITIDPEKIYAGITKTLEVKCIYPQTAKQIFGSIFSLSLLHSEISDKENFILLATVSDKTNRMIFNLEQNDFELSGQINNTGDSYIKISWNYPTKNRTGVYKCEVRVNENLHDTADASSSMPLTAEPPNIDMVVREMRNIQDSFNKQLRTAFNTIDHLKDKIVNPIQRIQINWKRQISSILSTIDKLQNEVSNQIRNDIGNMSDQTASISSTVNHLQSQISNQIQPELNIMKVRIEEHFNSNNRIEEMRSLFRTQTSVLKNETDKIVANHYALNRKVRLARIAMFFESSSFMGWHYSLSKMTTSHFSYIYAQAACIAYGGYLADLNSKAELEFLRKFLREQGKQFSIVFVGGAYNSHEALFTKTTSGVTRRKSRLGQKDDVRGNEKCISLNRNPNFELKEERCPFTSRKIRFGFICEVPD